MIASGRLRFGFSVSSPSGATDSKPESARIVNTTPRYSACVFGMLFGLKDEKLKPPEPGETIPETISATKIATSSTASVSITFTDRAIPNSVNAVTQSTRIAKMIHQGTFQPYCAFSVSCTSEPVNAQTTPIATGSYRK